MTLVNAPPSESPITVTNKLDVQRRRELRCFGGKEDLQPLRLVNIIRDDADVGVRSACITRKECGKLPKEADIGS